MCLIVEYASYGNLRDFLRQCEEVVLSLNHMPHIPRNRFRQQLPLSHTSLNTSHEYCYSLLPPPGLGQEPSLPLAAVPPSPSSPDRTLSSLLAVARPTLSSHLPPRVMSVVGAPAVTVESR